MLHLYETTTGKLISTATVIDIIPEGMAVVESDKRGTWNTSTLDFDAIPVTKTVSTDSFILWFTQAEKELLVSVAENNVKAKTFMKILPLLGVVDLDSEFIQNAVNGMVVLNVLTATRAAERLNG